MAMHEPNISDKICPSSYPQKIGLIEMTKEINFSISMLDAALIVKIGAPEKIKYSREKQSPTHPTLPRKHVENTSTHRMFSFAIPASQVYYESNENAMARQF